MSAYMEDKAHIDAIVQVGLGDFQRDQGIGSWMNLSWFASDPQKVPTDDRYFAALDEIRRELRHHTADEVGRILWAENARSIQHRYQLADDSDEMQQYQAEIEAYRYQRSNRLLTPVEALKAINGYEYQACEASDWRDTEAFRFCESLTSAVISTLPGYDAADTWSISDPKVTAS